jgi:hypothetical protein
LKQLWHRYLLGQVLELKLEKVLQVLELEQVLKLAAVLAQ